VQEPRCHLYRFGNDMRALLFAGFLLLIGAEALAQSVIIPHPVPNFSQRMTGCVAKWNSIRPSGRGTLTYRQYTTKCLGGGTAKPIETVAVCRNGTTAPATAPEGACAFDGGVDRWLD
jgi:hypothetical protein